MRGSDECLDVDGMQGSLGKVGSLKTVSKQFKGSAKAVVKQYYPRIKAV